MYSKNPGNNQCIGLSFVQPVNSLIGPDTDFPVIHEYNGLPGYSWKDQDRDPEKCAEKKNPIKKSRPLPKKN